MASKANNCDEFFTQSSADTEEIVISGISGRFPESDNMREFRDNLLNKIDLVTDDERRWKLDPEIPHRSGKINNISHFDATFFGIHYKLAHAMDPMCRIMMEVVFEAVIDAGVNPKKLKGRKIGVFMATSLSDSEKFWFYEKMQSHGLGVMGCLKTMLANRISYVLGVTGPSYAVDSACSSSFHAVEQAYRTIKNGHCEAAIVGGANLCLHPMVSAQYSHLGVLSPDGCSRVFDCEVNGYARSETISAVFIQKLKDAKRIYATVVHAKTNYGGLTDQGITLPSSTMQNTFLTEFYDACKIQPSSLTYIEAHGSATKLGDIEELKSIEAIFCRGKREPLNIGSVKSNMGHAEPASGMAQIAKVIIAYETGVMLPNLHYKTPHQSIKALQDGRLHVVTEVTPWSGGYVGINSFGYGGANAHVLLKSNLKEKVDGGKQQDDLPRIIVASGRTEKAVEHILTEVESSTVDVEFIRLLHEVHAEDILGHIYRGYTIVGTSCPTKEQREIKHYPGGKRPVWFIFSGLGSEWPKMGSQLLRFPIFANAIEKCDKVLKPHGINIYDILMNPDKSIFNNLRYSCVGITSVQIGLIDLLKCLGIVPDAIIGHSVGEVSCAYADGCFTLEQTILVSYYRGLTAYQMETIKGSMVAVGLGYKDIKKMCPAGIEVGCHNASNSSTICGPADLVENFITALTEKKIFARKVYSDNFAFHSSYVADIGPRHYAYVKKVVPNPKARTSKWLSTSIPQSQWDTPQAKFSSAEYHTNNIISPVFFEEAIALMPHNAIAIEIAPHGLLQAILKRALGNEISNISLTQRGHENSIELFLERIGKLYENGLQPAVWKLYPEVQFPVSRGTPMIAPLIKWDHSQEWTVMSYKRKNEETASGPRIVKISLSDKNYEYIKGHTVNGKYFLPATFYVVLVWETLGIRQKKPHTSVSAVFQKIEFLKNITISQDEVLELTIMIYKGTGKFEIARGEELITIGCVHATRNAQLERTKFTLSSDDEVEDMDSAYVYKEFILRGYQYSGQFKAVKSAGTNGCKGTIYWNDNWVTFLDNMLQLSILHLDMDNILVPAGIEKLIIDTRSHFSQCFNISDDKKGCHVFVNKSCNVIQSGGVEVHGLKTNVIDHQEPSINSVLETLKFVAHRDKAKMSLKDAINLAAHLSVENESVEVKTFEILGNGEKYPIEELMSYFLKRTLAEIPAIRANINIVTSEDSLRDAELSKNFNIIDMKKLTSMAQGFILTGRNLLCSEKSTYLSSLLPTLQDDAFIITLELLPSKNVNQLLRENGLYIVLEKTVDNCIFLLLKKIKNVPLKTIVIQIDDELTCFDSLKEIMNKNADIANAKTSRILLIFDKTYENCPLHLISSLQSKPGGKTIRCFLIKDPEAPEFSLSAALYVEQLKLDLTLNVLGLNRSWGSYLYQELPSPTPRLVHRAWANQLIRGDLASLQWTDTPVIRGCKPGKLINVIYSSINWTDIIIATEKLFTGAFNLTGKQSEFIFGSEYAGITKDGRRVMGLVRSGCMTNQMISDSIFTWTIPENWTLEQAATVPSAYAVSYYALYFHGKIKEGNEILIHAGSTDIGQAAITLALWNKCDVFTTVQTETERLFIKQRFPEIPDDHISNLENANFLQMIVKGTKGAGVEIVIYTLADYFYESLTCVTSRGKFIMIETNKKCKQSTLGMGVFEIEISFHRIFFDKLFERSAEKKLKLRDMIQRGLDEVVIKPLAVTIFPKDEISRAFQHMAAENHTGKVLIKIQDENNLDGLITALPYYYCRTDYSYVIVGDLEDFNLELVHWLISRGAQNLILISFSGVTNCYQRRQLKHWQSYGISINVISGRDASCSEDCERILSTASKVAPVDAIFLFPLNSANYQKSKIPAELISTILARIRNLDNNSRKMCPNLQHFVAFLLTPHGFQSTDSVSCEVLNSSISRICRTRTAEGFPAVAIQWENCQNGDKIIVDSTQKHHDNWIDSIVRHQALAYFRDLDVILNQTSPIVRRRWEQSSFSRYSQLT